MKKAILTLALIMSIGATQVSLASSAPKHRYHPTTQQVDPSRLLLHLQHSRKISRLLPDRHPQLWMMRRLLPILIQPQRILPTMLM